MSNIMMGIVAEMLAAHGAKPLAEEPPVEGGEGMLDALEADVEETFAAVLAEDPSVSIGTPEVAVLPVVSVDQRHEPQITGLSEQAPIRLENRPAPTTPRVPFEATEILKTPAPIGVAEPDSIETSFETISPKNTYPLIQIEAASSAPQASDRLTVDPPLTDKTSPVVASVAAPVVTTDATPLVAAAELPEHSVATPAAETVPIHDQPILADAPAPPRAEDPILAEAKPRDLPPERSESAAPIAQPIEIRSAGEHVDIPVEPTQDRPGVSDAYQDPARPDIKARGTVQSQVVIGDPIAATTAAQIAIAPEVTKHSQTQPDLSDSDPFPAKVSQTDEPDLGAGEAHSKPTTPVSAPTPRVDIDPISPDSGPPEPKPIIGEASLVPEVSENPQTGKDSTPPADVAADSAPSPSPLTSPPPTTTQTTTPPAATPTAVDLPQVDGSDPTPSVTASPPTERDVPPVAHQVAIAVSKSDGGTIELALRPVELGETQISMEFEAERLVVTVATERTETQDLMRRQIDDLAREFRDLGYRDVSFRFEQQAGQQGQSRQAQGETQNTNHAETEPNLSPETPAPRPTYVSGRLDIRL